MKKVYQNIHYIIFSVFVIFHGLINAFIPLYGDDYYYAIFVKKGWGFFISENILHYKTVNGRAFVHIIDELLIGFGVWPWLIFNTVLIAVVVWYIAKIASRAYRNDADKTAFKRTLIISCGLFCIIDMDILRESVYWATGAMNYLFPICLTIVYYYYFRKDFENMSGFRWLPVLAFFAAFTTEQASICSLAIGAYFIVNSFIIKRRRPKVMYFINLAASFVSFASVFFAPGNSVRETVYPDFYAMGIFDRISYNIKDYVSVSFGTDGIYNSIIILAVVVSVVMIKGFAEKKLHQKIFSTVYILLTAVTIPLYIYALDIKTVTTDNIGLISLISAVIAMTLIYTIYDYFANGHIDNMFMFISAIVLQVAMLITPVFGGRTLLISTVLMIVMTTQIAVDNFDNKIIMLIAGIAFIYLPRENIVWLPVMCGVVILFVLLSNNKQIISENMIPAIFAAICLFASCAAVIGYSENYVVSLYNDSQIEEYHKQGSDSKSITLAYMVNEQYRYTQPYDNEYHMWKYKLFNDIPKSTEILYTFYNKEK